MAINKWEKRFKKINGFWNQAYSCFLLRYTRFNIKRLRRQIDRANIDRLHVGCGNVLLKGWLNILYEKRQEYGKIHPNNGALRLNYNLLKPWPIENNSLEFIAGSHFIEHLDLNDGIKFLEEAFFNHKLIREWCAFKKAETPGEIFIAKAYDSGGSHKWFFDFDSLKHILESAGFGKVRKCGRLEGAVPDLGTIEPPGRELETLYVEAVKS